MSEFEEIKRVLLELKDQMDVLIPEKFTVSFVKDKTGVSTQAVHNRLKRDYNDSTDYWKEGGMIYMSKTVAFQLIRLMKGK